MERQYTMVGVNNDKPFNLKIGNSFHHPDGNFYSLRGLLNTDFPWCAPILNEKGKQTGKFWPNPVEIFISPVTDQVVLSESQQAQQDLYSLDTKLSRCAEDILNALIAKNILNGTEPELEFIVDNKSKKEIARNKL